MKKINLLFLVFFMASCSGIKNLHEESAIYKNQLEKQSVVLKSDDVFNRSENGNWQLRISGNPYELGYKKGLFTEKLYHQQERAFFEKVAEIVPNPSKQQKLIWFLKWYNRSILDYIPLEFKQELFTLSSFGSNIYNDLGTKFERNLLLHSSHDIGHAMQDLMLVGCSSIALWDDYTEDGKLLIGRNFDFYVSDAFAKNKIVEFIRPEKGYNYASVTWPGMIGVVSGMNEKGLTVTLNAGKSSIPLSGKTPVSIVARSILQYAQNIDEAIQIAKKYEVFVSESFLIASAQDNKAVVIEMSPEKFDVFEQDNGKLICTNHFQSNSYQTDKRNQQHIEHSHSQYRLEKLEESFPEKQTYQVKDVLNVLRDASGLNHQNIGLGNEKSLNQLLAHHSVIFKPSEQILYVSNNPYQLGAFDAYNLKEIFAGNELKPIKQMELPADDFISSEAFKNYRLYKKAEKILEYSIAQKTVLSEVFLNDFSRFNPNLWRTYQLLGDYYLMQKNWQNAVKNYELALQKEISSETERKSIIKNHQKALKKL